MLVRLCCYAVILLAGAAFSLLQGQDANGDQLVAHAHAAWAVLHPAQRVSLAPADWIPGTWNVPWLILALHAPAWVAVAYLGAVQAIAVILVGEIAWALLSHLDGPWRVTLVVLSTAFCVFGAASRVEFGTTFGDLLTGLPILAAVLIAVRSRQGLAPRAGIGAGLLLGFALGLKLTNLVYVLAFVLAVLMASPTLRSRLSTGLWVSSAAAFSSFLTGGYFWIRSYAQLKNPIFPFFNAIWRSPYAPDVNYRDSRFSPDTTTGLLTLPWRMAIQGTYPSERLGRDLRWAVLASIAVVAIVTVLVRKGLNGAQKSTAEDIDPFPGRFFLCFLGASWFVWLLQFSIARYLIPLELLSGLAIVVLLELILRRPWATVALALAALVACAAWVRIPAFDRQHVAHGSWYDFSSPALANRPATLLVLPENPAYNFTVLAFPDDTTSVTVPLGLQGLSEQAREAVTRHDGPVVTVTGANVTPRMDNTMRSYGFVRRGPCEPLRSNYAPASICPWVKGSAT
jgi:hypothetical protein